MSRPPVACHVCGVASRNPRFDMSVLTFNFLEGSPSICERCLFHRLTGELRAWQPAIQTVLVAPSTEAACVKA